MLYKLRTKPQKPKAKVGQLRQEGVLWFDWFFLCKIKWINVGCNIMPDTATSALLCYFLWMILEYLFIFFVYEWYLEYLIIILCVSAIFVCFVYEMIFFFVLFMKWYRRSKLINGNLDFLQFIDCLIIFFSKVICLIVIIAIGGLLINFFLCSFYEL